MGLLATQKKKPGLLANLPVDYRGTLGELPSTLPSAFTMKTSTQAVPDETTPDTVDFLKKTGQSIARGYGAVGQGIVSVATGGEASVAFTPQGKIQQAIFGTDKPFSLQEVGEEYPGVPRGAGFAPFIGGLGVALDLVGGGGLKGMKGLTGALKGAKTVEDAARLMKGAGFVDDVIKDYAPMFAKITDAKKIEEGLLAAEKLQNTTKVATEMLSEQTGRIIPRSEVIGKVEYSGREFVKPHSLETYGKYLYHDTSEASAGKILQDLSSAKPRVPETIALANSPELALGQAGKGVKIIFDSKDVVGVQNIRQKPNAGFLHSQGKTDELIGKEFGDNSFMGIEVPNSFEFKLAGRAAEEGGITTGTAKRLGIDMEHPVDLGNGRKIYLKSTATPTRSRPVQDVPGAVADRPSAQTFPQKTLPQSEVEQASSFPSQSLESLKHIPEETSAPFKQVVDIGAKGTKEPALRERVVNTLSKAFTNFLEFVQDTDVRVAQLLKNKEVTDASNIYQKMTAYPGIVDTKIRNVKTQFETLVNDTVDIADKSGRDISIVRQDINEYLQAVHAPERNAVLGDGAAGMTDAMAAKVIERINALPDAGAIRRVAEELRELNRQGLVLLRDAKVISDELFTTLTTKYKNHVPLNRIFDEEEIQGALSVRGFDVKSSGIKRAKGSEREVADIWGNIKHNYDQAVFRSEKNIVDQSTLAYVRQNRPPGLEIYKPKAIGKTFDGKIMMEKSVDPAYLQLYENGRPIWIHIKDPALAVALRGVGREKLPSMFQVVGAYTRFYAGLATRYALDFAFPNKLRDLQETAIYMAAQKDVGFKGAAKAVAKDPASIKAVWDSIRGVDSPGARLYDEMRALGGTTGGMGLSTRKKVEIDLDKMFAIAQSKPRQAAEGALQWIDNWNTVFEDSTRLSVYKQALSQGLSKERAAFLAKEASINFNRMGRGGPVINAIWMFSNASIQASAKMIRSLKNPNVAATVALTVGTAVGTVNQWNDRVDPDWRDKVTKWDRLNGLPILLPGVGGKDDTKGIVHTKDGINYIVLPVSWGIKPIKVMADYAYDAASGQETNMNRMASDFFTSVADAYNPLGGTDYISALMPTVLDMPFEIARNKSWSGSKIRPDFDKNAPKDVQYFSTLGETAMGEAFITTTKQLQEHTGIAISPADMKYAFENLIGGFGKFGIRTANVPVGIATGKPVPADEYPFVSRFYRTRTQEEVGMGAGGDTSVLKSVLENQSRERFYAREAAEDTYTRMKEMPVEEASAQFKSLVKEDPDLAKKVSDIAKQEKKGLTYTERLITQLGVTNGERALYIKTKFDELKSQTDKATLWQDYVTKGIITPQVADQISYLLKNPQVGKKSSP